MVKVEIFRHQSQSALSEKINKFIEDNNLAPESIHDIKLTAGPENQIIVMIIYMDGSQLNSDDEDNEEFIFIKRK